MLVAKLLDGGVVQFADEPIAGHIPANWIVPAPNEFVGVDPEFLTHDGHTISRKSQEEIDAIIAAREQARQDAKSAFLKQIENAYCDFLEGAWTSVLRDKGYIAPDFTVTVTNTTAIQNSTYLMQMMQAGDLTNFTLYSNLFLSFERAVTSMGSSLGDARRHT